MLLEQVRRTIDQNQLLAKGDRLIVGVSAGVDSMVLLHLLNALREEFSFFLIVAHINHGLRSAESKEEAELVRRESARIGLPFEYGEFNVKAFRDSTGLSLQDAARKIRFQFFNRLVEQYGGGKIVLGHNADDQVETILLRLMRGSGLRGLKGMLPLRAGWLVRPLLGIWRKEIEAFAREKEIPYLVDSSNLNRDYLRNRLRLDLIPLIEREYQPRFREAALRTSVILREENDYLQKGIEEAYSKVVRKEGDEIVFKFSTFRSLHKAIQWGMIHKILERVNTETAAHDEEWPDVALILKKLHSSSPSFLLEISCSLYLEKRYDRVSLKRGRVATIPPFERTLPFPAPGHASIEEIGKEVKLELVDGRINSQVNPSPNTALLDFERLQFPLRIRNFRPGDRFHPLGAKGKQKLKEFFIDHKVPKFERAGIPLLISGDEIAWVAGHRINHRFRLTLETRKILRVRLR